jgi:hypothetical protein
VSPGTNAPSIARLKPGSVRAIEPISPRRSEDIEIDRFHKSLGLVGHVRRDGKHLSGIHHDFFAIDPKLQRAFQDVRDLLVMMAVFRHDASLLRQNARHHNVQADDHLPLQERIQIFEFHAIPRDVLEFAFRNRFFGNRLFVGCRYALLGRLLLEL